MARLSKEAIERLKQEVDLVRLVRSKGVELKPQGKELTGRCPFHDDKTPSLFVNPEKNRFNCFGCDAAGSVIDWVMKAEGISYQQAIHLLHEGNAMTGNAGTPKRRRNGVFESPVAIAAEDQTSLRQVIDFYHQELKQDTVAQQYLVKRGLNNAEMIQTFRLGFASRNFTMRLPSGETAAGREIRGRLKQLGVIRQKTGAGHFNGCVTFPIISPEGLITEIYGRRVYTPKKGESSHWYLPGPHQGIWNEVALAACEEIILCESIIDALTFWCAGYRNVIASYGAKGFTADHLAALQRYTIKRILIAYDNDKEGNAQAVTLSDQLIGHGFETFRLKFPAEMDANDYALKVKSGTGNSRESLGLIIRSASWLGKGMWPGQSIGGDSISGAKEKNESPNSSETVGPNSSSLAATNGSAVSSLEATSSLAASSNGKAKQAAKGKSKVGRHSVASSNKAVNKESKDTIREGEAPAEPKQASLASPVPPAPIEIEAEVREKEIVMGIGNRSYRVRGLEKNLAFDVLKVNILVRKADQFYVDTFDLYAARARGVFVKEASRELGFEPDVIKRDLGKVLLKLEALQDQNIEETLAAQDKEIELTDKDKKAALELLKQPNLIERILSDFAACGVVGEETNKLVGYLAATSRKLDKPLAIIIQSSSAAGKSSLMDAILRLIPAEEQVGYSAMTGQSLFYMGSMELSHKILSIAEEEGIAQASYALKLLQSEGQLTIASTGKDPGTGRMETQEYHVEGPVMIFLTTTAIDIDEELLNRCVVLTVDENREQTRAIHDQQRKNQTLDGMLANQSSSAVVKLHQNAQRLIRPLLVVNPFADQLSFVDDCARRRRDHMKYLTLIQSIALLHQYQREIKSVMFDGETIQYIEVRATDIVLANRLADQVLGKSIDELPPQTRRLLLELFELVHKQCKKQQLKQTEYRFTRRFIRENLSWGQSQVKRHLERLMEMEYIIPHRAGGRRVEYELIYDGRGREGQPTMCGLIDVKKLEPSRKSKAAASARDKTSKETCVEATKETGSAGAAATNGSGSPAPSENVSRTPTSKSLPTNQSSSGVKQVSSVQTDSSSAQERPVIGPLSSEVKEAKPVKTNGKPR